MNSNTAIGSVQIKSEPIDEQLSAEQRATDQPPNMAKSKESEAKPQESQNKQPNKQPDKQPNKQPNQQPNKQPNKQPIGVQLNSLLNLNYSTRNQLINSLNQLSAILQCQKSIPDDAKQRTRKKIDDTMRLLVDLSPFEQVRMTDEPGMFEELISDELTVKLSRADRSMVMNHLMNIKDVVLADELITVETRRSLVTENSRIIYQLLELRSGDEQNHCEPSTKKQRVEIVLSEELNNLSKKLSGQAEQIARLEAKMNGVIGEPKPEAESVDTTRTEVLFKFELTGVSKFFEVDANERHSELFWCRGLQWSLFVEPNLKRDRSKHLGLYLHCHNDDPVKWSCKVDCKLILFSNVSESQNCFDEFVNVFDKKVSFGYSHFISYRELADEKNGYIKDDTIVLGAELKAGPVVREGLPEGSRGA